MSHPVEERKVAEALVQSGTITSDQLKKLVEFRNTMGSGTLINLVMKLGYASEADVNRALITHEIPTEIKVNQIDRAAMKAIPDKTLETHQIVALKNKNPNKRLSLAMVDTNNLAVIEELQFLTNKVVDPVLGTRDSVIHALQTYLGNVKTPTPPAPPPVKKVEVIPIADLEDDDIDIDDIDIDDIDESVLPGEEYDDADLEGALEQLRKLPCEVLTRAFILSMVKSGAVSASSMLDSVKRLTKD